MPNNISNYLADALLNATFRNIPYTSPTTVYLALYTADPTKSDTGTEVAGGGYARQIAVFSSPALISGKRTIQNTADIQFPIATADWGTVTHIGVRDALTNGKLLYQGPIPTARPVLTDDRLKFLAGDLKLDLD